MNKNISMDEIELFILQKCVEQHEKAETDEKLRTNKCAKEIDTSEVLAEITGESGTSLEYKTKLWLNRLAPLGHPVKGPLCRCSDSNVNMNRHKYNVRAFVDPYGKSPSAWDRIRELEAQITPKKELEQKFGILYSASEMKKDFIRWTINKEETKHQIALLFIDIDDFKKVNEEYTETTVDQTLLPEFQELLKKITISDGTVYRLGGEEFGILLRNHNQDDAKRFAEKLRSIVESKIFNIEEDKKQTITVSIGVALWPDHGSSYKKVLSAANEAEHRAKNEGKNRVLFANE